VKSFSGIREESTGTKIGGRLSRGQSSCGFITAGVNRRQGIDEKTEPFLSITDIFFNSVKKTFGVNRFDEVVTDPFHLEHIPHRFVGREND
jgi:hypothetical protein